MKLSSRAVKAGAQASPSAGQISSVERTTEVWRGSAFPDRRYPLLRRMLACADVSAGILASVSLPFTGDGGAAQFAWSLAYLPVWVVVAKMLGLYDRDERVIRHLTVDEVPKLVLWALIGTSGLVFFLEFTSVDRPAASSALVIGLVAGVTVLLLRATARWIWRRVMPPERVVLIGSDQNVDPFRRKIELFPDVHMRLVAVHDAIDIDAVRWNREMLGTFDRLVVAPNSFDDTEILALREFARTARMRLTLVPPCPGAFSTAAQLNHLAELPLLEYNTGDLSRSTLLLKRVLDVAVGALALTILSPLLAFIALAIKLDSPGPVFFTQLRAGLGGRPFRMRKFRSMVVDAEALLPDLVPFDSLRQPMFKLPDDPRVTRCGRFLRRWSLDELPQLWNVLIGDMSLVGPRPEQLDLVERYSPEQRVRLVVKPGLTGPMQVFGRGGLDLDERVAVERDYVENLGLGRDIRMLALTVSAVLKGKGAF